MCPGYRGIRSRWLIGRLLEYQKYNNCINTSYTLRREWFVMHWYNCQRREKLLSFNFPNLNIPMRLTQQRFFCWWHRLIFIISLILTMFSVVCSNHSFSIKRLKLFLILIKFWLYLFGIQEPKNNERICRMFGEHVFAICLNVTPAICVMATVFSSTGLQQLLTERYSRH